MSRFEEILTASSEDLLKKLYKSSSTQDESAASSRANKIARNLGLSYSQLVCAVGFNAKIQELSDVLAVIGFDSYEALARERAGLFWLAQHRHKMAAVYLNEVVGSCVSQKEAITTIVDWAKTHGRRQELFEAALKYRPKNPNLDRIQKTITESEPSRGLEADPGN